MGTVGKPSRKAHRKETGSVRGPPSRGHAGWGGRPPTARSVGDGEARREPRWGLPCLHQGWRYGRAWECVRQKEEDI